MSRPKCRLLPPFDVARRRNGERYAVVLEMLIADKGWRKKTWWYDAQHEAVDLAVACARAVGVFHHPKESNLPYVLSSYAVAGYAVTLYDSTGFAGGEGVDLD